MISLAIPVFKKPSFEQEILSVLYIPDVQGRLQIIVKVAEALLEGSGDPTAALCCTECLLSCSIESCCQLGTTGTLSQSSFCRGEVWYDSQDKSRIDVCMPDAHPDAFLLILRQVHFYFVSNSLTHANVSSSARAHSYKICALCPSPQQHSVLKINLPIFSSSPSSPRGWDCWGLTGTLLRRQSANMPCLWDLLTQGCTDAGGKQGNKWHQQQQKPSPRKVRFITVLLLDSLTLSALMAPFSKTIHTEESVETATSVAFA